jgi:hypothetical protein
MSWIKMRTSLRTHPKVVRISSALKADILRTVGGLHALWSVLDEHADDGILAGYDCEIMDGVIGWPGFCEAVISVGWLISKDNQLIFPEFDTHNSKSAKRRADDAVRKMSAREADKKRTREEKRREDINNSNSGRCKIDEWKLSSTLEHDLQMVFGIPIDFIDKQAVLFKSFYKDKGIDSDCWDSWFTDRCETEWKKRA